MRRIRTLLHLTAALLALLPLNQAIAEDPKDPVNEQIAKLEQQAKLAEARAKLAEAEAKRIEALGLPSFEGKVETDTSTGKFEVTLMAMASLDRIAAEIATKAAPSSGTLLVLAGDEAFSFGMASTIDTELDQLHLQLEADCRECLLPDVDVNAEFVATAVAALSAVAGLLRSDVTYSAISPEGIDSPLLASLVAGKSGNARLLTGNPGVKIAPPTIVELLEVQNQWSKATLDRHYYWSHFAAQRARVVLGQKSKDAAAKKKNAALIAKITAWLASYDAFAKRVTTADDAGASPLNKAIFEAQVLGDVTRVARVYARAPSGTLKKTSNLGTFFGADPLRITGGVAGSYSLFDPDTGKSIKVDKPILFCTTGYHRIRDVTASQIVPDCKF